MWRGGRISDRGLPRACPRPDQRASGPRALEKFLPSHSDRGPPDQMAGPAPLSV